MKTRLALISVYEKEGVVAFARGVAALGYEILSTGGTAKALREAGVPLKEVSEHTGHPEIMDGRVKTLHPKIHGGLLAVRENPDHVYQAQAHGIRFIDLVCCNLYPFVQVASRPDAKEHDVIENIDIGGPAMIRSAAKNYRFVTVVTEPEDYARVLDEMQKGAGSTSDALRRELAMKAYSHTARYDAAIAGWLAGGGEFPSVLTLQYDKVQDLRYGENPHQRAAFYRGAGQSAPSVAHARLLEGGKEISYNNLLDLDAAFECVREFKRPSVVIVKHNNPCGAATADALPDAFRRALAGDPMAAFGGIVAFNVPVDPGTAELAVARENFFEAIIAPGYLGDAARILREKPKWGKNLRLFDAGDATARVGRGLAVRGLRDGLLLQTVDDTLYQEVRAVGVPPTDAQKDDLLFAWAICKHVKSNAIVLVKDAMVVGVGAGQMSRVDSARIAVAKAGDRARGAVAASDAFFPFPDGVETLMEAGVGAIIQPGGSVRDQEVFAAAARRNVPMVLTGTRHFRH